MSKKHSVDFNKDYIGTIPNINNKLDYFLDESIKMIKSNLIGINKINRIVNLLKYTDALIDDYGEKTTFYVKSTQLLKIIYSKYKLKSAKVMLKELRILTKLNYYNNTINNDFHFTSELNFLLIDLALRDAMNENSEVDFKKINFNSLRLKKLLLHKGMIISWKYGNASIEENNNQINVCALTDYYLSFIRTRDLSEGQRTVMDKIIKNYKYNKNLDLMKFSILYGINELAYGNDLIDKSLNLKELFNLIRNKKYDYFGKSNLLKIKKTITLKNYTASIINIIDFMSKVKISQNLKKINKSKLFYFVDLSSLPETDKNFIINNLVLKNTSNINDMYDTPFIKGVDSNLYIYSDFIDVMDPSSIISRLLESDKSWNDLKGNNFQNNILNTLDILNDHSNKSLSIYNSIKQNKRGSSEIDIIINCKNNSSILELKTFKRPTSIKEYRINVDKMFSLGYINHFINNFTNFSNGKFKNALIKNHIKKNKNCEAFFISDYIFPDEVINLKNGVNYVQKYELNYYCRSFPQPKAFDYAHFFLSKDQNLIKLDNQKFQSIDTSSYNVFDVLKKISQIQPYKNYNNYKLNFMPIRFNENCFVNDVYSNVYYDIFLSKYGSDKYSAKKVADFFANLNTNFINLDQFYLTDYIFKNMYECFKDESSIVSFFNLIGDLINSELYFYKNNFKYIENGYKYNVINLFYL